MGRWPGRRMRNGKLLAGRDDANYCKIVQKVTKCFARLVQDSRFTHRIQWNGTAFRIAAHAMKTHANKREVGVDAGNNSEKWCRVCASALVLVSSSGCVFGFVVSAQHSFDGYTKRGHAGWCTVYCQKPPPNVEWRINSTRTETLTLWCSSRTLAFWVLFNTRRSTARCQIQKYLSRKGNEESEIEKKRR